MNALYRNVFLLASFLLAACSTRTVPQIRHTHTTTTPREFSFAHGNLLLNRHTQSSKRRLYLIYNKSTQPVILDRPAAQHTGASAGWASILGAKHWSAIVVDRPHFMLSCARMRKKQWHRINCRRVLSAQTRTATPSQLMRTLGSFWVFEDIAPQQLASTLALNHFH